MNPLRRQQVPFFAVERNLSIPLQSLLRCSHVMFPLLPEAQAVDHSVDAVIAYVRVYLLDEWVKLDRPQGSPREQILDSAAEDCLIGFSLCPESKDSILGSAELTGEFPSRDGDHLRVAGLCILSLGR